MSPFGNGPGGRPRRFFLGAFGQPGHAFPMLALGRRLVARGHTVAYETWSRWRTEVEAAAMEFVAAPEAARLPPRVPGINPYRGVVYAAGHTRRAIAEFRPDAVVHDILTLAPAMAGELEGVPVATLIPHLYPVGAPGLPPYASGARKPRTELGRRWWHLLDPMLEAGLRQGRAELNATRTALGLEPVTRLHGGLSPSLVLVGSLPQLEYPRDWPREVHVVGPLEYEPPYGPVEAPPGDEPLVLVAPSTAQDPEQRLLRAAVEGLADEPVRVLATWNRRLPAAPVRVPANARLVEWVSYTRTMPDAAVVVLHAGHGTLARALTTGCRVLAVPHVGDMAENAARVDWAGVGARLPWRFCTPQGIRWAIRRVLADEAMAARVRAIAEWAAVNDGATRAAELVEQLVDGGAVAGMLDVGASRASVD